MSYPTEPVVVLASLHQHFEALCPVTGEIRTSGRSMGGLTKEMIVDYGDDWLDVQAEDIPSNWLLRITQTARLTSAQLPDVVDDLHDPDDAEWMPRAKAMAMAKAQLRRFARLKRWGSGP